MRGYFIDELSPEEVDLLRSKLSTAGLRSSVEDLFWLPVPEDMLNNLQKEHFSVCGPYCLGLELIEDGARLEFLVRAQGKMRCECLAFAEESLRKYMVDYLEGLLALPDTTLQ